MAGPIATAIQGVYNKKAARAAAELAEKQKNAGLQLVSELDYEPMYASERVPTYQRSESPIARSYLESMLAGNNPDATFSGSPNAAATKLRQQTSQNQMFGTMDERVAKQRALHTDTPWWKVTPPTREIKSTVSPDAAWTAGNSDFAAMGMNKPLSDAITETGDDFAKLQANTQNRKKSGLNDMLELDSKTRMTGNLLKMYGGDANRLAADVRAAGGLDKLYKQKVG